MEVFRPGTATQRSIFCPGKKAYSTLALDKPVRGWANFNTVTNKKTPTVKLRSRTRSKVCLLLNGLGLNSLSGACVCALLFCVLRCSLKIFLDLCSFFFFASRQLFSSTFFSPPVKALTKSSRMCAAYVRGGVSSRGVSISGRLSGSAPRLL